MDNNMPVNSPPAPNTNVPQPTTPVAAPPPAVEHKSSKKMILMLILGIVIVVILVGGAYLFVNSKKEAPPAKTTETNQSDTLESDINAVDVGDLDAEFSTVDQDLQNL